MIEKPNGGGEVRQANAGEFTEVMSEDEHAARIAAGEAINDDSTIVVEDLGDPAPLADEDDGA